MGQGDIENSPWKRAFKKAHQNHASRKNVAFEKLNRSQEGVTCCTSELCPFEPGEGEENHFEAER